MKSELTMQMQEWIDREADGFEPELAVARKKSLKKLPLYMGISIAGLCVFGFAVGAGVSGVLRLHLPIGVGIAAFIALFTLWQQNSIINKKAVIKAYQKGAMDMFKTIPVEEQTLFCAQMSQKHYSESVYQESQTPFPTKVIIGPEYWVYRNAVTSFFVKSSHIARAYLRQTNARVTYEKASSNVKKNVAIGVELVVEYREGSEASKSSEIAMYFDNNGQAAPVLSLIQKHCPHIVIK